MPKLTILVGPPGSGKSTLANELEGSFRISQDDQGKDHLELFKNLIDVGTADILVDRMNFNKAQRARYLNPAKAAGYETEIIVLHENRETCFKRMVNRYDHPSIPHNEPKIANSALDTFFCGYERPTPDEADTIEFRYPTPSLKAKCIWVDIDGTAANTDHRQKFMDGPRKDWKGFFSEMHNDSPNAFCKLIIDKFKEDHLIVFASGRPDNFRKVTEEWLTTHKFKVDELFMRHRSDSRKDSIVKEIILDFEVKTRYPEISFAIDDRTQVVEMLRNRGIIVLQCAKGDF